LRVDPLQRQIDNPVSKLFGLATCPNDVKFLNGGTDGQDLWNKNQPRRIPFFQETVKVARHGFTVVRNENAPKAGSQRQYIGVFHRVRDNSLGRQEVNGWVSPLKTVDDPEAEVRVGQQKSRQAGLRSFSLRYRRAFSTRSGGFPFRARSQRRSCSAR